MNNLKEILQLVWDLYSQLVALASVILLFLFIIIGGEFRLTIYMENLIKLIRQIIK